jgi:hypothetical protein
MTKHVKLEPNDKQAVGEAKQHELTVQQREALRSHISRLDEKRTPKITVSTDGRISIEHPNKAIGGLLLLEGFGTANAEFATDLIVQLMAASQEGTNINKIKFNAMLSIVTSSNPRNEFDAMLAAHAAITHFAIMKTGRQMATAENVMQQESAQRMYTKLARTFMDQKEALKRGRAAENVLTVQQNVNVSEGGQAAVVAHVSHTQLAPADVQNQTPAASPLALPDAKATPMPIIDERAAAPAQIERFRPARS